MPTNSDEVLSKSEEMLVNILEIISGSTKNPLNIRLSYTFDPSDTIGISALRGLVAKGYCKGLRISLAKEYTVFITSRGLREAERLVARNKRG